MFHEKVNPVTFEALTVVEFPIQNAWSIPASTIGASITLTTTLSDTLHPKRLVPVKVYVVEPLDGINVTLSIIPLSQV